MHTLKLHYLQQLRLTTTMNYQLARDTINIPTTIYTFYSLLQLKPINTTV